ncbi:MAG: type II toxin-antitoxin system RelE/ParE family toxin [Pseudolabrys sp.]|nr:type II toxin-antitoxin system RelE/ParE family toxin [Pseudolabrys sp.]
MRYTAAALEHLESIYSYIAERNEPAARRIVSDIRGAAERLRSFPRMARAGGVSGTQEWVVRGSPYLIVYEVDQMDGEIVILAVVHGAQDWQNARL